MIIRFDDRIKVAAPASFADAVRKAADEQHLSVSDFARAALAREIKRVGVDHPTLPPISSPRGRK